MSNYEWVNTPGYDERQVAGKPLHAVNPATQRSACGLRRKVWSFDLFNERRCERCERALKKAENGSE